MLKRLENASTPRRSESTRSVGLSTQRCAVDASAVAHGRRVELEAAEGQRHRLRVVEDLRSAGVGEELAAAGQAQAQQKSCVRREDETDDREDRDERPALARASAVGEGAKPDVGDERDDAGEDRLPSSSGTCRGCGCATPRGRERPRARASASSSRAPSSRRRSSTSAGGRQRTRSAHWSSTIRSSGVTGSPAPMDTFSTSLCKGRRSASPSSWAPVMLATMLRERRSANTP